MEIVETGRLLRVARFGRGRVVEVRAAKTAEGRFTWATFIRDAGKDRPLNAVALMPNLKTAMGDLEMLSTPHDALRDML